MWGDLWLLYPPSSQALGQRSALDALSQGEGASGLWSLTPLRSCPVPFSAISVTQCQPYPQVRAVLGPCSGQGVGHAAFSVKCMPTAGSPRLSPSPLFPVPDT